MDQSSKAPSLIGWMDVNDVLRGLLVHLEEKAPSKGMATTPAELAEELRRLGPEFMNRLVGERGIDRRIHLRPRRSASPAAGTARVPSIHHAPTQ